MLNKISIIIIVKNERGIADTLAHLATQEKPVPTEILVIDASHPDALKDIKEAYPEVKWHQFVPKIANKSSIPEQRNYGIQQASGDIIVFIDASCIPVNGWLTKLTAPILSGEENITAGQFDSVDTSSRVVFVEGRPYQYLTSSGTANLAFRKSVWEKVGEFDENFLYGSDIDFAWRCVDAGYRICLVPNAGITHDWGTLARDLNRSLKYGEAKANLFIKHPHRICTQLLKESMVIPVYTVWFLSLSLSFVYPLYPLSIVLFVVLFMMRNPGDNPIKKTLTTLTYVIGFYQKLFKHFIK